MGNAWAEQVVSAVLQDGEVTILTIEGEYFDFINPEKSRYSIEGIAHSLARLCRFTGHVPTHLSVAQHCVVVSELCSPPHAFGALMHDAAEAFTGDLSGPLKRLLRTMSPAWDSVEQRVESDVMRRFGVPYPFHPAIKLADMTALAWEQRDIRGAGHHDWSVTRGIEPPESKLVALERDEAEALFLRRFHEFDLKF